VHYMLPSNRVVFLYVYPVDPFRPSFLGFVGFSLPYVLDATFLNEPGVYELHATNVREEDAVEGLDFLMETIRFELYEL